VGFVTFNKGSFVFVDEWWLLIVVGLYSN